MIEKSRKFNKPLCILLLDYEIHRTYSVQTSCVKPYTVKMYEKISKRYQVLIE
jgi:hypothetical protein